MKFTPLDNLADLNASDTVYQAEDGTHVKVRVLRIPVPASAGTEQQRNTMVLKVSASLCDELGKALPDTELGHQVAPAHTYNIHVQREKEAGRTLLDLAETYRIEQCTEALAFKAVIEDKSLFVTGE